MNAACTAHPLPTTAPACTEALQPVPPPDQNASTPPAPSFAAMREKAVDILLRILADKGISLLLDDDCTGFHAKPRKLIDDTLLHYLKTLKSQLLARLLGNTAGPEQAAQIFASQPDPHCHQCGASAERVQRDCSLVCAQHADPDLQLLP